MKKESCKKCKKVKPIGEKILKNNSHRKNEWVAEVMKVKKGEKISFKQALINASRIRKNRVLAT